MELAKAMVGLLLQLHVHLLIHSFRFIKIKKLYQKSLTNILQGFFLQTNTKTT